MAQHIIQWNCRGFRSNLEDLKALINDYSPVCVVLQETLLKPAQTAKIRRYSTVRRDNCNADRAVGGVAILVSHHAPSSHIHLRTSLQAVAMRISFPPAVTICCVYLPPSEIVNIRALEDLVDELQPPFLLLGDFNGHHAQWGCASSNSRGLMIERLLSDLELSLLNTGASTYFHAPTRTFTAIDLSICSPAIFPLWTWRVLDDPLGSDHFPVVLTLTQQGRSTPSRTPKWKFDDADWGNFQSLAHFTIEMVENPSIDGAVEGMTSCILQAAKSSIPKTSKRLPKLPKPWWNHDCSLAQKAQKKAWGKFRR